jgi:hypothetical protein
MLPFIDRIGRRFLLLTGAVLCALLHFTIAGLMASKGHFVPEVNGNPNLRWVISGPPSKGVIACSYIFVGIYGLTWVCSLRPQRLIYRADSLDIGTHGMDLLFRSLSAQVPCQGCWSLRGNKLGLQLRPRILRRARIPQHRVAHVHCKYCFLRVVMVF